MSNDATNVEASVEEQPNGNGRRRILLVITIVIVVLGIAAFFWWSLVLTKRERTDDAYVGGTQVAVSSQTSGNVVTVSAEENQLVSAGQVLIKLDDIDAKSALNKAESALAQAVRQFHQIKEQASLYDAAIASRELDVKRAQEDLQRREPLLAKEAIAAEELRHVRDVVAQAQSALQQAQHQSRAAHALVDGTDAKTNPAVMQARRAYIDAWVALQRATIVAPVTGHVAQKTVQPGQRVQPGQPLLSVIPLETVWVDANFKEVQLRNLRIGQPAEVKSDLYGSDVIFKGKVSGIGAGTGAAFSLLPAQNASGNWIKVIQRVPVRIALDEEQVAQHPLRVGLSTVVTVDTHDRSGRAVPDAPSTKTFETRAYELDE
ncbi:MAG TPA: HlyD family efflux transporter periplasmic adaptor subunit, partial [Steroidobacteraceae bacterium]|nr:HlyD family efflux transporter periplasmic adaptor subunit [Steroidobacteraceae bacterium]